MIKVKHLKTGRVYELISKGKMKVNGEWLESYIYGGKDKTTGEYTYFTRMKEDFENHFIFMDSVEADEIWHDGLICQPMPERSYYDPVVYLVNNILCIGNMFRMNRAYKWAYSSDLINWWNFKSMPKDISSWVDKNFWRLL